VGSGSPEVRPIDLECAGRRLAARLIDGSGGAAGAPAILFVHGLRSDQQGYVARARVAAERLGAVCLTFDLGGHGESDGDKELLSPREHLAEVCRAYDALHAVADSGRVGVCGASYGGLLAALLAGERPVSRLLLRAPALYPDALLDVPLAQRGELPDPAPASIALDNLATFGGETLVLESGRDAVIAHETIAAYLRASPRTRHELMPDAEHHLADPAWKARFQSLIVEWFAAL
jgi:pimeloyl-ACP methyl ester carboxylesterase